MRALALVWCVLLAARGASAVCDPSFNANIVEIVYRTFVAGSGAIGVGWPSVCVFLSPLGRCPRFSVDYFTQNTGNLYSLRDRTGGNAGDNIQFIVGGNVNLGWADTGDTLYPSSFKVMSNLADMQWKLYKNYAGTSFPSSSNYAIYFNGGATGYYWDGPLAGGSGRIIAGSPPGNAGVATAPNNNIVVCATPVQGYSGGWTGLAIQATL